MAAYPTIPLSVPIPIPDITSVKSAPEPLKLDAVTTPWNSAPCYPTNKPLLYTVAPVPIGVSAPNTFIPAASTPTL